MREQSIALKPQLMMILCFMAASLLMQMHLSWFVFERDSMNSQPWRYWTGHWVHLGWKHLLLNFVALVLLPVLFVKCHSKQLLWGLLSIAPVLSLMLYFCQPQLMVYAGLSGVLHGIFVALALYHLAFQSERILALLLLLGVGLKLYTEQHYGDSQTADIIGFSVIIDAHLYGAMCGVVLGGIWLLTALNSCKPKQQQSLTER